MWVTDTDKTERTREIQQSDGPSQAKRYGSRMTKNKAGRRDAYVYNAYV